MRIKTFSDCKSRNLRSIIITLLAFFLHASLLWSQTGNLSFSIRNADLRQLFELIESKSGVMFSYKDMILDDRKDITLAVKDESVEYVLDKVLSSRGLVYTKTGNTFAIKQAVATPAKVGEEKKITGTIVDEHGEPVIGANVIEKGTTNGVITDVDGKFSLQLTENAIMQISYIGYITQEIAVGNQRMFTITLQEDFQALEEVVVVGYGVQKKSVVTGAISSIKSEDMYTSVTNPEQALQGKTSGVQVISSSGSPGAAMKLRIRGYSSNGSSDPLYIVDGLRTTDISGLDPNNIESMEVLKDAASAAIYGAEGGNGVVLISTKTGNQGSTKVTYDFQYSVQSATNLPKLMNAEQYIGYHTEAGNMADGVTSEYDTNWLDELFESAPMQKHNLSVSGANDKSTYYASLGYLKHDGIIKGNNDQYQRISGMFNGSYKVRSWLKIGSNLTLTHAKRNYVNENHVEQSVVGSALVLDPLTPVKYTGSIPTHVNDLLAGDYNLKQSVDGNYYGISNYVTGSSNPFVQRDILQSKNVQDRLMGNIYADVSITDGLTFSSKLGFDYSHKDISVYTPGYYYNASLYNHYPGIAETSGTTHYWQWENYASYIKTFNEDHNFTFMLGTSVSEYKYKQVSASGSPLTKDKDSYAELDYIQSQDRSIVGGYSYRDRKLSYFGRISYNYKEKYLAQVSLRRDAAGLSILPKDKRWGTFPAASVGWVLTNEDFFPETFLSHLKIRASWGQNGSVSNLQNYQYASNIIDNIIYPLGDGEYVTGSKPEQLGNNSLKWETSEQMNIGLDARAFNDRLTFTMDYFNKKTKDLITDNTPPLEAGNAASPINGGDVRNRGFEFELGWRDRIGDFNYGIKGNFATLDNKVTYLNPTISRLNGVGIMQWTATAFEKNMPIWYFRGYKTNGINPETGDVVFVDTNGDGEINADDQTYIGSGIPDFTYGATINLEYKDFDFTLFATGSVGNDVLMGLFRTDRPLVNRFATYYTDRWTPANTSASLPKADVDPRYWTSDAVVYDGSFLKIKQIQLGYTLPRNLLRKVSVANARLYVSLDDFFTITDYPGIDPEASSGDDNALGVDRGYYPLSRKVLFGLSVTF